MQEWEPEDRILLGTYVFQDKNEAFNYGCYLLITYREKYRKEDVERCKELVNSSCDREEVFRQMPSGDDYDYDVTVSQSHEPDNRSTLIQ